MTNIPLEESNSSVIEYDLVQLRQQRENLLYMLAKAELKPDERATCANKLIQIIKKIRQAEAALKNGSEK